MFVEKINMHKKETIKVYTTLTVVNSKWKNFLISFFFFFNLTICSNFSQIFLTVEIIF